MLIHQNQLGNSPVSKLRSIDYNRTYIKEYKELYNNFKNKGVLIKGNFEDKRWVALSGADEHIIVFAFSEIQFRDAKNAGKFSDEFNYEDFELSVKGFILYQLDLYSANGLRGVPYAVAYLLNEGILANDKLPDKFNKNASIFRIYYLIKRYFLFISPHYRNEELIEDMELKYYKFSHEANEKKERGEDKRALPSIMTMFKFDDIIREFIVETAVDDPEKRIMRERFFPIVLWWMITTILPMRTQEFSVIPKDCLFEKDGVPYLKFYRNVIKGRKKIKFDHSFEACFREEEFPINEEIKVLIEEYRDLVQYYDEMEDFYGNGFKGPCERKFLLSYRSYKRMLRNPEMTQVIYDREFFQSHLIHSLLDIFFIDYVVGELGMEVIPKSKCFEEEVFIGDQLNDISLMDTRHYAIMNMIFMGYEPATVQRIVGHNSIHQSLTYFDHPEQFIKGYIVSLAKQDALKKNNYKKKVICDKIFDNLFGREGSGNERYRKYLAQQSDSETNFKRLSNGGKCSYQRDDMIPCMLVEGVHERCRFFISTEKIIHLVEKEFDAMTEEISTEFKTLKYLTKNIKTLVAFREQYKVSVNKIRSKAINQAEMITNHYFRGLEGDE